MALPPESTQADFTGQESPFSDGSDHIRDIGSLAVWSLSGAKPGNGVDQLLDDDVCCCAVVFQTAIATGRVLWCVQPATYWQSDGTAPHLVNVQFHRKMSLQQVSLYVDFSADESYTPKKLCIRAGSTAADLRDVLIVQLHEPVGWINIPVVDLEAVGANRWVLTACVVRCLKCCTTVSCACRRCTIQYSFSI